MASTFDRAWIERMQGVHVLTVAAALGLRCAPGRGASGGSVFGCPVCQAERRHSSRGDRRGALGVRHDGTGFRCMSCDASGDGIDLVALVLRGVRYRDLTEAGRTEVREWCALYTGAELAPAGDWDKRPLPPPPPAFPPEAEVREFWEACVPVCDDEEVLGYLQRRNVRVDGVVDFSLARALPSSLQPPAWAGRWVGSGHRLIVPLYDSRGLMRSVLGRSIRPDASLKSLAPSGFTRAGLVMACPFARWLLATGERPDWWQPDVELRVVIAEGETDFLVAASQWSDAAESAPATLGIVSGSWSAEFAARIANRSVVVVATDHDAAGERYAALIAESFNGRSVRLERWEATP